MRPNPHQEAVKFYQNKLIENPGNARYNHFLGTLRNAEKKYGEANLLFQKTLAIQPNNILARNDYAIALSTQNRNRDGVTELQKAMLQNEDLPVIRRNIAVLYGRYGDFNSAVTHAVRAVQLDPQNSQGHRNLAKIYDAQGDTTSSLEHNKKAIALEEAEVGSRKHTSAYRAAAVQIIAKGGDYSEAHKLMDAARRHEGKRTVVETTQKTYEIIGQIMKRRGNKMDEIREEERKMAEREQMLANIKAGIMPQRLSLKGEQKSDNAPDGDEAGEEALKEEKKKKKKKKKEEEES